MVLADALTHWWNWRPTRLTGGCLFRDAERPGGEERIFVVISLAAAPGNPLPTVTLLSICLAGSWRPAARLRAVRDFVL